MLLACSLAIAEQPTVKVISLKDLTENLSYCHNWEQNLNNPVYYKNIKTLSDKEKCLFFIYQAEQLEIRLRKSYAWAHYARHSGLDSIAEIIEKTNLERQIVAMKRQAMFVECMQYFPELKKDMLLYSAKIKVYYENFPIQ